uniref:Mitochondrial import inner membrane translocase subunit tim-16 n=1 Tax=Steinernema glaseri TaxID=37863 RepID=A0A1I8A5N1_9BILA
MVWRNAAKIILAAGEAVGKAFFRAVKDEIRATQQAAANHAARTGQSTSEAKESGTTSSKLGITLQEAVQILNVKEPLKPEEIEKNYKHLFEVNDKTKGGSFYLQSKVYRAKERIDEELRNQSPGEAAEKLKKENES